MTLTLTESVREESSRSSVPVVSLFVLAAGLVVYAVFAPRWLEPIYEQFSGDMAAASLFENIGFQLWLAAVPLAVILAVVGGSLTTRTNRGRAWWFGAGGVALVVAPNVIAAFVDRTYAWFFGTGGALIAVLALLTAWSWAGTRSQLRADRRLASDLRMGGLMAFAFAAWFTCGVFALPVYGLDPLRMIAYDSTAFAMPMAYAMMTFFVIGWALTYTAQLLDRRHAVAPEATESSELVGSR